jgi:nucleotidyltransferase substrate binding protein (TIGR01987 family)
LKDYLEAEGNQKITGPRSAITEAFKVGLISDGEGWMQMFKDRNISSHTYNEDVINEIAEHIYKIFYSLFLELQNKFKNTL